MVDSSGVRTFIAVNLAPEVHAALVRLKAELARLRSDVRWVRDDGLHATLKFLGPVAPDRLDGVRDAVSRAAGSIEQFSATTRGLGAFPSMRRPRVVWVGLEAERLTDLAHAIERALVPLRFPAEDRPFHAHITLGRVGGQRGWDAVEEVLKAHWTDDFGVSLVDHVTVYRSDLHRDGAVYAALWTSCLADSRRGEQHGIG